MAQNEIKSIVQENMSSKVANQTTYYKIKTTITTTRTTTKMKDERSY